MKLVPLSIMLVMLLSGCSLFKPAKSDDIVDEKTTTTKTTRTEQAIRHSITVAGVLSVGAIVAGSGGVLLWCFFIV